MQTQMDKLIGYKEGGDTAAIDAQLLAIMNNSRISSGLEPYSSLPGKSFLSKFSSPVPIPTPTAMFGGWGKGWAARNATEAAYGADLHSIAALQQEGGINEAGTWTLNNRNHTVVVLLDGTPEIIDTDHSTRMTTRTKDARPTKLTVRNLMKYGERQPLATDASTFDFESEMAEQPSSTEPLSTQRAQEQQAYAQQSEMEGYQAKLAQDKSEAQAKALAEAEAQSMTSLRASEAQQEAKSYADWSGDAGLAGTPGPQATPATTPAGTVASPHGGGQPTISITPLGGGWKSASGGLVQNMYDGGVVRMAEGGDLIDLAKEKQKRIDAESFKRFRGEFSDKSKVMMKRIEAEDWKYNIGDRVRTEHGITRDEEPWEILGKWINDKGLMEESNPREGSFITGPNVKYYKVVRGKEGEQEFSYLPEWAFEQKFGIREVPEEGIPGIPSNLNVEATSPETFERNLGFPIPQSVRKRLPRLLQTVAQGASRRLPAITTAYAVYNSFPKTFGQLPDILEYLKDTQTHELFGLDKSGLEYLQETLDKIFSNKISVEDINKLDFYHGTTTANLEGGKLRASTTGSLGRGLYISPDPKYSDTFAGDEGGNIHHVNVNIENPLIIPFTKTDSPVKVKVLEVLDITREEDIVDTAMKHGYDSIFVVDAATNEIIEASIFDEENVRSLEPPPRISGTPTRAERIEMQGGPLSRRLKEEQIVRLLEGHGFNWEYNEAGGITAIESDNSKKHFRENTSLRTIRDWLGYYKGGQVRPMYDGGLV
jgi:hypothetical protein